MAENNSVVLAQEIYKSLCAFLEKENWKYEKNEEKLEISCGAKGDDLPMDFNVIVDPRAECIILLSHMPFDVPEDKRIDMVMAVTAINNSIVNGCFDFNINTGNLLFRLTNNFCESIIGEDALNYMMLVSGMTVDKYNDKLLMLAKGMMPISKLLEEILA